MQKTVSETCMIKPDLVFFMFTFSFCLWLKFSFLPLIVNNGHAVIWILSLLGNMYGQDISCLLYVFLFI